MVRRHTEAQKVREAHQIARDNDLALIERPTTHGLEYKLYRCLPTRRVYLGKRSSPDAIRAYVAHVAKIK